jgi:hypothetical protein
VHGSGCCAGIAKLGGGRCVRIVADEHATEVKQGLSEIVSEQIYSLAPAVKVSDVSTLVTADIEQARSLMESLLSNKSDGKVLPEAVCPSVLTQCCG